MVLDSWGFCVFRKRLAGPEVFLAAEDQLEDLLNKIAPRTEELKKESEELHRTSSSCEGWFYSSILLLAKGSCIFIYLISM
jgi:hypothetical protein